MSDKKLAGALVPSETHDKIERFAAKRGANVGGIVRVALAEYLQKHGEHITLDELSVGKWGGDRANRKREPA